MARAFEVTLTTHTQVLMEGDTAEEVKECMRIRCAQTIARAIDYEITVVEVKLKPGDDAGLIRK